MWRLAQLDSSGNFEYVAVLDLEPCLPQFFHWLFQEVRRMEDCVVPK